MADKTLQLIGRAETPRQLDTIGFRGCKRRRNSVLQEFLVCQACMSVAAPSFYKTKLFFFLFSTDVKWSFLDLFSSKMQCCFIYVEAVKMLYATNPAVHHVSLWSWQRDFKLIQLICECSDTELTSSFVLMTDSRHWHPQRNLVLRCLQAGVSAPSHSGCTGMVLWVFMAKAVIGQNITLGLQRPCQIR